MRTRSGTPGPTRASTPSANAVSVDMAAPQPAADERPKLMARKIAIGMTIPPRATTSGSASRRRSRSSPISNSRRASRPATKKKNAISPEFTQPCQLSARPLVPDRITSSVCQVAAYPAGSMLAQASAASVAASRTAALPVSVRRNWRSGVSKLCAHTVRSENDEAGALDSVTPGFSLAPLKRTPDSPSRLHCQDLHRFHGLHRDSRGSALSCPLTTRQASLDATDRSVASLL